MQFLFFLFVGCIQKEHLFQGLLQTSRDSSKRRHPKKKKKRYLQGERPFPMSKRPAEENGEGGARKRAKFDENDLDWLIGDLRKEESQLIITRLVKVSFLFFFFFCFVFSSFSFCFEWIILIFFLRFLVKRRSNLKSIWSATLANNTVPSRFKNRLSSWLNSTNSKPPPSPTDRGWKDLKGIPCS